MEGGEQESLLKIGLMGVAYYVSLEGQDLDSSEVDGKGLAAAMEDLNMICEELKISSLEAFLGQPGDELADLLGDDLDLEEPLEEIWFPAADGLAVVRPLLAYLRLHPGALANSDGVLSDLDSLQQLLQRAEQAGLRWHLSIDF